MYISVVVPSEFRMAVVGLPSVSITSCRVDWPSVNLETCSSVTRTPVEAQAVNRAVTRSTDNNFFIVSCLCLSVRN